MKALAVVAVGMAVVCALPADGQVVRGQVRDSVAGAPVPSGFVVLLDGDGAEISRTLSSSSGRFMLALPANQPGPFRLRSERIGYQVSTSTQFYPPTDGPLEFDLVVRALPIFLSAIEVREESECRTQPGEYENTSVLWEEARKALAAASWTAAHQAYQYVSNMHERTLDARLSRVLDERFRREAGLHSLPFVSRDPSLLERQGYVVDDNGLVYYAPDAHVLQDEGFLSTHCFSWYGHGIVKGL